MKIINNAFSLVELMVVIAIISVLSSIAVPAYQTYIIRSKFVEIITIMQSKQIELLANYNATGSFVLGSTIYSNFNGVSTFGSWGMSNNNVHIYVHLTDNAIYPGVGTRQLNMQLMEANGIMKVACYADSRNGTNTIPTKYLPSGCNGSAQDPSTYVIP